MVARSVVEFEKDGPASTILSCLAIGCQIEPIKNVSALRTTLSKENSHERLAQLLIRLNKHNSSETHLRQ